MVKAAIQTINAGYPIDGAATPMTNAGIPVIEDTIPTIGADSPIIEDTLQRWSPTAQSLESSFLQFSHQTLGTSVSGGCATNFDDLLENILHIKFYTFKIFCV